jgi:hypothetical protein
VRPTGRAGAQKEGHRRGEVTTTDGVVQSLRKYRMSGSRRACLATSAPKPSAARTWHVRWGSSRAAAKRPPRPYRRNGTGVEVGEQNAFGRQICAHRGWRSRAGARLSVHQWPVDQGQRTCGNDNGRGALRLPWGSTRGSVKRLPRRWDGLGTQEGRPHAVREAEGRSIHAASTAVSRNGLCSRK